MKAIKLYLKDHISFLLFQGVLVLFLLFLFWLDGFRNINTAIYSIIISFILTVGFLSAKFVMRRFFYKAITVNPKKMEDALILHTQGPEHVRTAAFTRSLYRVYQDEVQSLYSNQSRQLKFMNHWVHQMKTPISVINLLMQEEKLDRESIIEEVNRIQSGLDSVLINARLETFEQDMRIERISLKKVVEEAININKRLLISNGVFPVLSVEDKFIITTDEQWFRTVLEQFITNAVKYTFESGKRVYFNAEDTEKGVILTVRDEGVGIRSADLKRVTNAFFTGENGRLTGESTGMGLYIASEVCRRLGHQLVIDSEVGVGTTITVLFENSESGGR